MRLFRRVKCWVLHEKYRVYLVAAGRSMLFYCERCRR